VDEREREEKSNATKTTLRNRIVRKRKERVKQRGSIDARRHTPESGTIGGVRWAAETYLR